MTKTVKTLLLSAAFATALSAAQTQLSKTEIASIEKLELFKQAQIKVDKAIDAGSLYLLSVKVRGAADEIYLTKDKKFIVAGDAISTSTGEKLTIPLDMTGVIGKEAFTYGTGTDEYILFTDPQCPYCKKFESYFPQIKDKVKIRVFYFPLDFHAEAKDISLYIMSQKTQEAKEQAMLNTNKNTPAFKNKKYAKGEKEALEKSLEEQMNIASKLKVRGTPAVFDPQGNKVSWPDMLKKYGMNVQ